MSLQASRIGILTTAVALFAPQDSGVTLVLAGAGLLTYAVVDYRGRTIRFFLVSICSAAFFLLVLASIVPLWFGVLAALSLSFIFTSKPGNADFIVCVLIVASLSMIGSLGATLQGKTAGFLQLVWPLVLPIAVLTLAGRRALICSLGCLLALTVVSFLALSLNTPVRLTVFILAICVAVAFCFAVDIGPVGASARTLLIALAVIGVTWSGFHTFRATALQFWLPNNAQAYEAQFYENYGDVLALVGINAQKVASPADIRDGALVLVPWATEAAQTKDFLNGLVEERRTAHVVLAAEHTNYQGHAQVLNGFMRGASVNDDTTVPPGNRDWMGNLRTFSMLQFPPRAALNRGASLTAYGAHTRVHLQGDAIFADQGIGEPLWVGDFVQSRADRRGPMPLAVTVPINEMVTATVVGDGSFLINKQIVSNPQPLLHIIALASGIPAAMADGLLAALLATIIFAPIVRPRFRVALYCCVIVTVAGTVLVTTFVYRQWAIPSRPMEAGAFSGYDERSFNSALVKLAPRLLASRASVFRHEPWLRSDKFGSTGGLEFHFGHASSSFRFHDVNVTGCWRAGTLDIGSVRIMDAQGCQVTGRVRPILKAGADTIVFELLDLPGVYVFLDRAFLVGNPVAANEQFVSTLLRTGSEQ